MPKIPVFGLGTQSRSRAVTSARMQNFYIERRPQGEKSELVAYGTPGLDLFKSFGDSPVRGMISFEPDNLLYVVHRGTLYEVDNAGVSTSLGSLNSTVGKVSMVHNGTTIMIVDGTDGYIYTTGVDPVSLSSITNVLTTATATTATDHGMLSGMTVTVSGATPSAYNGTFVITVTTPTAFTYTMLSNPGGSASVVGSYTVSSFQQITDVNLISNPMTVTWLDQYFIVENSIVFQISTDPTTWDATEIGVPETSPDGIVRVFADHGELLVFNQLTIEPWTNTGATDFPFAPIKSSVSEWGCAAQWSICKFNDSVAFLAKNRLGQASVCLLKGYVPQVISTPDVDHIINGYATVSDATAISYMLGGHPMYQINFPTAGYSWLYDGRENFWSSLKSEDSTRQRNEIGVEFLSRTVVSDFSNGSMYNINPNTYTENGEMIEAEIISENIATPDNERFSIDCFRLEMETGVGLSTGQGSDPQVMLQISRDRGQSYGAEMWRSMGKIGDYARRIDWMRLGPTSTDFNFKLRVTDPVKRAFVSASINPND